MTETEFRFAVPRACDQRVAGMFTRSTAGDRYDSVYFDTPDKVLWRHGIDCQVASNGKGHRQTVSVRVADVPLARANHVTNLNTNAISPEHLRSALPADVAAVLDVEALAPVFRTRLLRRKRVVVIGGAEIETVYEQGRLTAGDQTAPIDEVAVRGDGSAAASLTKTCLAFLDDVPCGLRVEDHAARGHGLLSGAPPDAVQAKPTRVEPETPLPVAIQTMMRSAFAQMLANHPALLADAQPEAIHQMRVGVRRLRSILSTFAPVLDLSGANDLVEETRALFGRLGVIREADVFVAETVPSIPKNAMTAYARDVLTEQVALFRDQTCGEMTAYMTGPAFARLAVSWYGWIESGNWLRHDQPAARRHEGCSVGQFAGARLAAMDRKMIKRGRRAGKTRSIDDWHRVRIAAKKLRYASSPLTAAVDERGSARESRLARRLAKLQDQLGTFNDMCSVEPFLARVAAEVPDDGIAFAGAAAACTDWSTQQVAKSLKKLKKRWRDFEAAHDGVGA